MTIERKILLGIFLLIFINFTFQPALAQINETVIEPVNDTLIAKEIFQYKNEIIILNATFTDSAQKTSVEDIFRESQNSFDKSLSILNLVGTLMAVLVALITIVIMVAIASGYFERKRWVAIRNDAQNELNNIKKIKENLVNDIESTKKNIPEHSQLLSAAAPSKEVIKYLDNISSKYELAELLGVALKPEDYSNRAEDLFYKKDYDLALSIIERGIKLHPNNYYLWANKSVILDKLERYQEELESIEKTICLKPNSHEEWDRKGAILQRIGRYNEAIIAYDTSLTIRPNYPNALFNKACCYSLMGDKDKMLDYLKRAIAREPTDKIKAKTDIDFEKFWNDKDFKNLIE